MRGLFALLAVVVVLSMLHLVFEVVIEVAELALDNAARANDGDDDVDLAALRRALARLSERQRDEDRRSGGGGERQQQRAKYDPALATTLATAALRGDASKVRSLLSHPRLDINADLDGGRGSVLFKVSAQPESESTVEVVRVLLKHPRINPNGGSTAWAPLKAAVHAHNRRIASAILDHPRTLAQVHAEGLPCSVLDSAPPRVVFVVNKASAGCFRRHKKALLESDPAVVSLDTVQHDPDRDDAEEAVAETLATANAAGRRSAGSAGGAKAKVGQARTPTKQAPRTPPSSGTGAATSQSRAGAGGSAPVGRRQGREIPAPQVVNPEDGFESFFDVTTYYLFARWSPYTMLIAAFALLWCVLSSSAVFFAVGASARWRAEERAEAAAAAELAAAGDAAPAARQ